jgi:hypothetical protein
MQYVHMSTLWNCIQSQPDDGNTRSSSKQVLTMCGHSVMCIVQERTATCTVNGEPSTSNDVPCHSLQNPVLQQPCLGACHAPEQFSFWLASEDWSSCRGGEAQRMATCHSRQGEDQPDEVIGW